MKTDWPLIREMMNAAIDACERIEATGFEPTDRDATTTVNGQAVSVSDFLTSGWSLPETVRYSIIRARHDAGNDLPYVPETARILTAMAAASAELIGALGQNPASGDVRRMIEWFKLHAATGVEKAVAERLREL